MCVGNPMNLYRSIYERKVRLRSFLYKHVTYSKTIFPLMCDKMSWIVMIITCIIASMFTRCSYTPSVIDELKIKYILLFFSFFNVSIRKKYLPLHLWQDFHYRAMQEILLHSNKYLVLLENISNTSNKYVKLRLILLTDTTIRPNYWWFINFNDFFKFRQCFSLEI